jgi:hypothetical protein
MTKRYPAYRQRVTGLHRRFHTVRMRTDPTFDIHNHISEEQLPAGVNGKAALEDAMALFIAKEWDLSRPLWEAKVLYGYEDGTGAKAALIARAHHSTSFLSAHEPLLKYCFKLYQTAKVLSSPSCPLPLLGRLLRRG